ncbi:MAG: hypothetical protein EPN91_00900 [Salinibacterium sp.]|nr:MAG: hypothetical protein EPN91_00900 [Salinibacterium sp.]
MPTFEPPAPSVPPIDSVSLETQLWDTVAAPAAPPASALPSTTQTTPLPADLDDWWSTSTDPRTGGAAPVPPSPERSDNPPTTQLDPGSGIDALFGETQFQDFSDEPMIAPLPPRDAEGRIREPRPPIPKTLKTLMWIAGGLLAALLLVALFAIGTRMAPLLAPAAPPTPTPTGAAPIPVGAIGPVAAGNHDWNDLLGGECLASFESAWQASYQVVDCTQPHAAQMVFRGTFDYLPDVPYPGTQELLSKANLACSASTVIDYAAANVYKDVQVSASFAADQSEWDDGNHSFLCYVSRSSGETFTTSIAMPPVAITAAPTATPTPAVSPSATAAK